MATPPVLHLTSPDTDAQESMFDDTAFPAEEMSESQTESTPHAVLSADEFAGLEERVLRAVNLVRRERQSRIAAEQRATALESQLHEAQGKSASVESLLQEVASLRAEREQVRTRVDSLLSQLDALEL